MWNHPLTIALVAVGSSLLTIFLTPRLQHHFWKIQRRDELRLAAISEFNRLTNAYAVACRTQTQPGQSVEDWLREIGAAGATIRALFSDRAYQAVMAVDRMITPIGSWVGPENRKRVDEFSEMCHVALKGLYAEVIE